MKTSCEHINDFLKHQENTHSTSSCPQTSVNPQISADILVKSTPIATNAHSSISSVCSSTCSSGNLNSNVNVTEESNFSTTTSTSNVSCSSACNNQGSLSCSSRNTRVFRRLEKIFENIAALRRSASLKTTNDQALKYPVCDECKLCSSRLHICASCEYVGCFTDLNNHIVKHANNEKHYIIMDISYGMVYCCQCNDYQYDEKLEDISNRCFLKEKLFRFGKFTDWEPSHYHLNLLKLNSSPNKLKTFRLKNSSIIGLRGLLNLGNTCFMNCILQALTHTPMLRDYFLSDQHNCSNSKTNCSSANPGGSTSNFTKKFNSSSNFNGNGNGNGNSSNYGNGAHNATKGANKKHCLVCEISTLFQEFYSGKRTPHIPFKLLHLVWTQVKHLAGYEQQDAHEFFIAALNAIHKNCIENDEEFMGNKPNGTDFNNCNCIIDRIFTGGLQSDIICSNCNNVSTKVDPFWDISLDLGALPHSSSTTNQISNCNKNESCSKNISANNNSNQQQKGSATLEDCLRRFTLPEILTNFNCSYCKCNNESTKQLTMKKLPIVGCFHFKRFEHSLKFHKKISTHISFPEILDMTPFMSSKRNQISYFTSSTSSSNSSSSANSDLNNLNDPNNQYFLFAVVNHHGTIESGHYTCFIRLTREQWFKCDDHLISKASINDVMNSEGYLLFYHKIWLDYD